MNPQNAPKTKLYIKFKFLFCFDHFKIKFWKPGPNFFFFFKSNQNQLKHDHFTTVFHNIFTIKVK